MWFEKGLVRKSIFSEPALITVDNYFSGEQTWKPFHAVDWGMLCTTNRNRLIFAKDTLHCSKVDSKTTKADRMMPPITILLKDYPNFVHCSFLSTGPTNIVGVNALPRVNTYTRQKHRGRGEKKRIWEIEMNEARDMYLTRYGVIDRVDARLRRLRMKLLSCRYHLGAMLNGFGLAVIDAFGIWRDLADGNYGDEYKIEKEEQLGQDEWVMNASVDGVGYKTIDGMYPGDANTRLMKQSSKKKRKTKRTSTSNTSANSGSVHFGRLKKVEEKRLARINSLANNMGQLIGHDSIVATTSPRKCKFCGGLTYKSCAKCNVSLCAPSQRAQKQSKTKKSATLSKKMDCHHNYHNPALLGCANCDVSLGYGKYDEANIRKILMTQQNKK
jgi:hypothetical protein